jgi:uncharacterized membrane protein SpoIIM required for sporulation
VAVKRERGLDPTLTRLGDLVDRASKRGVSSLSDGELVELARAYRYGATRLSAHESEGRSPELVAQVRGLLARAHALLGADFATEREPWRRRFLRFYLEDVPRTIRSEWKLLATSFVWMYGIALISYFAVARDLDMAWTLFDPGSVSQELQQLQSLGPGEAWRGNFTFGVGASPFNAGFIMTHNMYVAVMFFAAALLLPLYALLLTWNGLMVGVYTGVATHYGQAGNISSILWCHGTLEIQAFVLAGAAGLVLVRAWIAPGAWTRRQALRAESARAWKLLAAVFPMLFFAGTIEGFVSPHAPFAVRIAVAISTGTVIVLWVALSGRSSRETDALAAPAAA